MAEEMKLIHAYEEKFKELGFLTPLLIQQYCSAADLDTDKFDWMAPFLKRAIVDKAGLAQKYEWDWLHTHAPLITLIYLDRAPFIDYIHVIRTLFVSSDNNQLYYMFFSYSCDVSCRHGFYGPCTEIIIICKHQGTSTALLDLPSTSESSSNNIPTNWSSCRIYIVLCAPTIPSRCCLRSSDNLGRYTHTLVVCATY